MTRSASLRVILCGLAMAAAAARQSPPIDVAQLGPQIGARLPAFSALDQFGRTQTLDSIVGEEGAMVVFFRSADW